MFNRNFMAWLCGEVVSKLAQKIVGNSQAFTQYAQNLFVEMFRQTYTHFYTSSFTHNCAQRYSDLLSVISRFYTVCTGPTITTTLYN